MNARTFSLNNVPRIGYVSVWSNQICANVPIAAYNAVVASGNIGLQCGAAEVGRIGRVNEAGTVGRLARLAGMAG